MLAGRLLRDMEGTGRSELGATGDSKTDKGLSFLQEEGLVCQNAFGKELASLS